MKFSKGFTLIEVIISIMVMAIAAAALLKIYGTAFTGSAVPAGEVQSQYNMIQRMETITSQYRNAVTPNPTTSFKSNCVVDSTNTFTLAAFKSNCIDGTQYVDSTNTGFITLTDTTNSYTTQSLILQVTLTDGKQKVTSFFTQ
jgi:prepilin-type N-terminal cleavage/methylation domain-containing protein